MDTPKYTPPLDPELAQWVAALDDDAIEFWSERSAVREHMGGQSRAEAEAGAWKETRLYLERRNCPAIGGSQTPKDRK